MLFDRRVRTSALGVFFDIILTSLRIGLAFLVSSAALFADAYHSISDLMVSVMILLVLLFKVWLERKERHHQNWQIRAEALTVISVSLVIFLVPFKLYQDLSRLTAENIDYVWLGIAGVLVILMLLHFIAKFKAYVAKQTDSLVLEADAYHSKVDMLTSLAVLCSLIGILIDVNIDMLVAVGITIMIALLGAELLISGIKSLISGQLYNQLSLFELVLGRLTSIDWLRPLINASQCLRSWVARYQKLVISAVFVVYVLSGLSVVPYGYVGIQTQLGAVVNDNLEPGLHYTLPVPFGGLELATLGEIRTISIGSERSQHTRSHSERLWFEIFGSRAHMDDTNYIQTGDENLVALKVDVQYRVSNYNQIYYDFTDLDEMVQLFAEFVLWDAVASLPYHRLLENGHDILSQMMGGKIQKQMKALGADVQVLGVQLQSAQPPASLVAIYRDVLNAHQESQDLTNQARSERLVQLPLTQAKVNQIAAQAEVDMEYHYRRAEGDVERFLALAEPFEYSPQAFMFERYIRAYKTILEGRDLTIIDPHFERNDLRIWFPIEALKQN